MFDFVDDIGEAIEDGVENVVEGAGELIDDGLDIVADGADAIGLDGAAEALDDFGDTIASATGGNVEERELGETEDPAELILGKPSEIGSTAQTLSDMADALEMTGQALKQIDSAEWVGDGADAFDEVYDKQPKLWFDGADAMSDAARAMTAWHNVVKTAQDKAADAIDEWKAAAREEQRQINWWNSLTAEQQAQTTLVDTWTPLRNNARSILRNARIQRDNGATIANSAFSAATDKAPAEPPFSERWLANLSDLGGVLEHGALNFMSGLLTSLTGLVQFVRQINPLDTYNLTHPAEYLEGLSNLGTGLVVAAADPGAAVSAILDDARRNPFEFMGALTGDALLTVATGGGGSAKVAISALRRLADAGQTGRRLDDLGRHLPNNPAPTPNNTPGHANVPPHQAGPAPDTGHTPDTNPMDTGSRPDADNPPADPPRERDTDDEPPVAQLPDHTPDDPPPARPDNDPPAQTDPDPTPQQSHTPGPDRTPDPDPPGPGDDPDPPLQRTDPRPDAANPSAQTDPPTTTPSNSSPSPTTPIDPSPTPATHGDPGRPPATHPDTDPASGPTSDAPRDTTPDPGTPESPGHHPETETPASRTEPDPGHTPPSRPDSDTSESRPGRTTDDPPANRPQDSDSPGPGAGTEPPGAHTPDHSPGSRPDNDPPAAHSGDQPPGSRADGDTPGSRTTDQPGSRDADGSRHTDTPPPYLAPGTHTGPGSPAPRPDSGPHAPTRTPDQDHQSRRPDSNSSPARTPDPAHPSRTPGNSSPARASEAPPHTRTSESSPARPGPTTRADPEASSRARPHPAPDTRSDHDSPAGRPESAHPGSRPRPDGPGIRTPNDETRPRTDDHDAPRSPTRRDDSEAPTDRGDRNPANTPEDRHPHDRDTDHDPGARGDRDTDAPSPRDRPHSDPDNTADRGRNDRNPDNTDRDPHETDRDTDEQTAHDRAEADRTAFDHARSSGPESDRTPEQKTCSTDPVDISTGEFLLPETDFDLPGVLPLSLRRAHHSNYRFGRWFGPSWSSTLDVRLVVDDAGVTFLGEDGIMLAYPHAEVDVPVHPLAEGQLWSLTRTEAGGYRVHDQRRELIWHFVPETALAGLDVRLGNYAVSAITDRHYNRTRFRYDADGAPVEVSHSGGYRVRVDTNRGRVTGLSLLTADLQVAAAWRYAYTAGNLTAVTDPDGATLRYTYDAEHRMTSWTDTNGNRMVNTYDEAGRVIHQRGTGGILNSDFAYLQFPDGTGRLTVVTDSTGAATQHGFDRELQLRDLIDPAGGHTHIDYNADRRPLTVTGPDGTTTAYRYTETGDVAHISRPDGKVIALDYAWRKRPGTVTDADGTVTRREWSDAGNLATFVDQGGNRTEFTYHANGALAAVDESSGARTTVRVDAAGLPVEITDPFGAVTRIRRDAAGRVVEMVDPLGGVTRHEWSARGKLLRRTDPDGHTESWTYDGEGNVLTHTDQSGAVVRYTYGDFDLLHSRTDPDGTVTGYTWDTERRLVAVANPIGQTWSYEYDRAGRLIAETDYSGATTRYTHDRSGRVATVTPATGITRHHNRDILGRLTGISTDTGEWIRYTYDPAGRILQAINGIGADPTHTLDFAYTPAGQVGSQRLDGAETVYEHDRRGNRTGRTTPSGAVTTWRHDLANRVERISTEGQDLTFDYDPLGRLTSWRVAELAVTRELTAAGRVTGQEVTGFPARALTLDLDSAPRPAPHRLRRDEFAYRPDGYLTAHTTVRPASSSAPAVPGASTERPPDASSGLPANPARATDVEVRLQRTYGLDAIGRVTTVAHNGTTTERYRYDGLSNITGAAPPTATAFAARTGGVPHEDHEPGSPATADREYRNNLLLRAGRTRYHYDSAGRLIRKTTTRLSRKPATWHYRYNGFDQLTDVWTPDRQWWHYTYDALGRRTTKQRLAPDGIVLERTDYAWEGAHLLEQTTAAGSVRWEYGPASDTPVTQIDDRADMDRKFHAIVTDLVGAPSELVDPSTAESISYSASSIWGITAWHGKAGTPLRFPGQIHDPETGLHYNVHRYYDPGTGRYITPDPMGLAPAANPSTYPHNPLTWVDPLGLACKEYANTYGKDEGGVLASLSDDGVLEMAITNQDDAGNLIPGLPNGREMFRDVVNHFGRENITAFQAKWIPRMPSNLNRYNELVQQGFSRADAALGTWTGKMVREFFGFTSVLVDAKGAPGMHHNVEAFFFGDKW